MWLNGFTPGSNEVEPLISFLSIKFHLLARSYIFETFLSEQSGMRQRKSTCGIGTGYTGLV